MSQDTLRVLVVDDAGLYRTVLSEILSTIDGVEVVGTAANGKIALDWITQLRPDMLTLDLEMPVMDGLETLRRLRTVAPQVAVLMVSMHTSRGAQSTIEALEMGALDFITKPEGSGARENIERLRNQLRPIINAWRTRRHLHTFLPGADTPAGTARPAGTAERPVPPSSRPLTAGVQPPPFVDVVVLGASTGGPQALTRVLPALPATLRVPIVIAQHMPPMFTAALASTLNAQSALRVVEGRSGTLLEAGTVYIAPGGKQMKVMRTHVQAPPSLLVTDDPPENHCKPSVDYLCRSVAQVYAHRALGVIMTGMGADGVQGLQHMKRRGAKILAQDEASCVVFGMPMEAVKAGVVDAVVPLGQLADVIQKYVG